MPYDPDRLRRRSIRLHEHDYSAGGTYFITICTSGREMLFGEVSNSGIAMNECGWIVWEEWERSAEIRSEIELDIFEVMPNHVHGMVTIVPSVSNMPVVPPSTQMRPRSLSSFVAGFKSATTKRIGEVRGTGSIPIWQRNYYERVVRNEDEYARIWHYIETNPLRWKIDLENPNCESNDPVETWLYANSDEMNRRL